MFGGGDRKMFCSVPILWPITTMTVTLMYGPQKPPIPGLQPPPMSGRVIINGIMSM